MVRLSVVLGLLVAAVALLAIFLLPAAVAQPAQRVRVVTSIPVFADFVRSVGGERVEVQPIVPSGGDVHTFEPTPADVRSLLAAHLVLVNGRGLDDNVARAAQQGSAPVWILSAGLDPVADGEPDVFGDGAEHAEDHAGGNPHLWMDPLRAIRYVELTRDALTAVDPDGSDVYASNAAAYIGRLYGLNAEVGAILDQVPSERRNIVTFHDGFAAFAERYGFRVVGLVLGNPEEREPSARQLAELSQTIRGSGVRTVFTEPQFNARSLELVARDLGVRLTELYSDTFVGGVSSYEDMIRTDALRIAEGLR